MTQVSAYPLDKKVSERVFMIFTKVFQKLSKKEDTQDFLSEFLTPTEKIMLSKRISIAVLLLKGFTSREISAILKVSLTTVSSVNLNLKYGKGGYKKVLLELEKEEKLEDVLKGVLEKALSLPSKSTEGGSLYKNIRKRLRTTPRAF